jgi:hypothetical protein
MEKGWVSDGVMAQSDRRRLHCGGCAKASPKAWRRGDPYKNDVSVRISAVPAFLHEMSGVAGT